MKKCYLPVALIAAAILFAGCSNNVMTELEMPKPAETGEKPTLEVRIETTGSSATIFVTTDLIISEEHIGMKRKHGEGHIHLYVDDGEKIAVSSHKYLIDNLQPGKHKVKVSLHNNDHTPYGVFKQTEFEIK
ncbi:hypothetical protein AB6A23_00755 [Paenibacillus tarimensis]